MDGRRTPVTPPSARRPPSRASGPGSTPGPRRDGPGLNRTDPVAIVAWKYGFPSPGSLLNVLRILRGRCDRLIDEVTSRQQMGPEDAERFADLWAAVWFKRLAAEEGAHLPGGGVRITTCANPTFYDLWIDIRRNLSEAVRPASPPVDNRARNGEANWRQDRDRSTPRPRDRGDLSPASSSSSIEYAAPRRSPRRRPDLRPTSPTPIRGGGPGSRSDIAQLLARAGAPLAGLTGLTDRFRAADITAADMRRYPREVFFDILTRVEFGMTLGQVVRLWLAVQDV